MSECVCFLHMCTYHVSSMCVCSAESGWWQATEDTAEASSQAGDKHSQLLLPILNVQHKWWDKRLRKRSETVIVYTHSLHYPVLWSPIILYLSTEALNQGETVDLDALMADLCSIEQELSTISKPNSTSRGQGKGQQSAPGGRSASAKHTGTSGGGSSGGSPVELYSFTIVF